MTKVFSSTWEEKRAPSKKFSENWEFAVFWEFCGLDRLLRENGGSSQIITNYKACDY
jgi:hypothetical protein